MRDFKSLFELYPLSSSECNKVRKGPHCDPHPLNPAKGETILVLDHYNTADRAAHGPRNGKISQAIVIPENKEQTWNIMTI